MTKVSPMTNSEKPPITSNPKDCPFCESRGRVIRLAVGTYNGCSDPACDAYNAEMRPEHWNKRPTIETPEQRAMCGAKCTFIYSCDLAPGHVGQHADRGSGKWIEWDDPTPEKASDHLAAAHYRELEKAAKCQHDADKLQAAHAADPTNIDELRLFFLYPEWPSGRWAGMRPKASDARPPLRMKDESGIVSVFNDGTEYVEKTPTPIMKNGKVVGLKRYPMHRISFKDPHPGRTRRAVRRLRRSGVSTWNNRSLNEQLDECIDAGIASKS